MANVEVVYIPVDQSPLRAQVTFVAGMTVTNVLKQSGLLDRYPELAGLPVGIFSRMVQLDTQVKAGDRIEIYRALTLDPMETRRQRAKKSG
jgi:putative ubiquitin-RnfH superfamily antitoxin RatB of RatAB toxin-antitoxin module